MKLYAGLALVLLSILFAPTGISTGDGDAAGSLTVCLVMTVDGEVRRGEEIPDTVLTVEGREGPSYLSSHRRFEAVSFRTPIEPDTDLFGDGEKDAVCVERTGLRTGKYFYAPVAESGRYADRFRLFGYSDGYEEEVTGLGSMDRYTSQLFNDNRSDDGERNVEADGHVILTRDRPHRRLVVHAAYTPPDDVDDGCPACPDGPVLEETVPPDGATDVNVTTPIVAVFDRDVGYGSGRMGLYVNASPVDRSRRAALLFKNHTLSWVRGESLSYGTLYSVRLPSGLVVDDDGGTMDDHLFSFVTGPPPDDQGPDDPDDDDGGDGDDDGDGDDGSGDDDGGNGDGDAGDGDDGDGHDRDDDGGDDDQDGDDGDGGDDDGNGDDGDGDDGDGHDRDDDGGDDDQDGDDGDGGGREGDGRTGRSRDDGGGGSTIELPACDRSDYVCSGWTRCSDGTQERVCERTGLCYEGYEPVEARECTVADGPVPDVTPPVDDEEPVLDGNVTVVDPVPDRGPTGMFAAVSSVWLLLFLVLAIVLADLLWVGIIPVVLALLWVRVRPGRTLEPREPHRS